MPQQNRIIPIRHDETIEEGLNRIAREAAVKTHLKIELDKQFHLDVDSEYKNELPKDIVSKIDYCTEQNEPFGLCCEDSIVIISPGHNTALWYGHDLNPVVHQFKGRPWLAMFVSTLLYTHQDFMSPWSVDLFLQQVKTRIDERQRPKPLLPDSPLSESGQPPRPLETGEQ